MNYYTVITPTGAAKEAAAHASGVAVRLTHMAVGDSGGTSYEPTGDEAALKNEVWRGAVDIVYHHETHPNWVVVEALIPPDVGPFTIREVSVYDSDGDMYAIGNYPETIKPVLDSGASVDVYIRLILAVSNAADIQLMIDPSAALATRDYVAQCIAANAGDSLPLMDGVAEVGVSTRHARDGHRHPVDTSRQPLDDTLTALAALVTSANQMIYATGNDSFALTMLTAFARTLLATDDSAAARNTLAAAPIDSPEFTGTPTAPTAPAGTNSEQLATTEFVTAALAGKQPLSLILTALAALQATSDQMIYSTSDDTFAMTALTELARNLLAATDAATARGILGIANDTHAGEVKAFAGQTAPTGWLECNGAYINAETYADLYAVLGTIYGPPSQLEDGTPTFKLPDLRGRFVYGALSNSLVGSTGGATTHALTIDEMPSHSHVYRMDFGGSGGMQSHQYTDSNASMENTSFVGGGAAHNNMPPFCTLMYIIKY